MNLTLSSVLGAAEGLVAKAADWISSATGIQRATLINTGIAECQQLIAYLQGELQKEIGQTDVIVDNLEAALIADTAPATTTTGVISEVSTPSAPVATTVTTSTVTTPSS